MTPWDELPYEIEDCTPEEDKLIKKCFTGYTRSFMKCGKHKYVMPGLFKKHAQAIYNMEVRETDVWVITYPRSGTTWTQEMVWLLMNNLDFATAQAQPLYKRFPMLEITSMIPDIAFELLKMNFLNLANFQGLGDSVKCPSWISIEQASRSSPRFIKTHLPLSLLPPGLLNTAKVVYVARDPRDVCVSYYFLQKMIHKHLMRATMSHYWEVFRRDLLPWAPIISHANEAWEQRHHPNLHFVFYEDMLKHLPQEIERMSQFLNREYSATQRSRLAQHLSFSSLRSNKTVNNTTHEGKDDVQFIRKGEVGGWKEHFDEKMEIQAEEFLTERLHGLTLSYPTFQKYETTRL